MTKQIKFGTDGWRGLIADDFTFENVARVACAISSYVIKNEDPRRGLIVGYDTRFASKAAAAVAAETIASFGIPVKLAADYTPTPAISFAVKALQAAGGVIITSSHNPWNWNGVKFKGKFGGSATPAIMRMIEDELNASPTPTAKKSQIEEVDLKKPYIEAVSKFVDLDRIAGAKFKIAVDAMHGSGGGVLSEIFEQRGIPFVAIRQELNPLFPGINPEPIEPHVAMLQQTVVSEKCHAGFATDGDADRIGAVAEDGSFIDSHKILSVILRWLLERKKWPGEVVRAFNTTLMLDRIAARYERKLNECPIGFKYIVDLMMQREILIGGEESGGIGYSRFLPERDGILNSLILANVMAEEGKPLGHLVADLQREYGAHFYGRLDLHITDEAKQRAITLVKDDNMKRFANYPILRKENLDGVKMFVDLPTGGNGAVGWILFRVSGTEPLLRVYAEAASPALVNELLSAAKSLVNVGDAVVTES